MRLTSLNCFYFSSDTPSYAFIHTLDFIHTCDDLNGYHFNYLCKFYTILKLEQMNNKSFLYILLIFSCDINLNPGTVYNNESLDSN